MSRWHQRDATTARTCNERFVAQILSDLGHNPPPPRPPHHAHSWCHLNVSSMTNNSIQVRCDPGHYCVAGIKKECPQGTFGNSAGLHDPRCSGLCPPGSACPGGTADPIPCLEGLYAVGGAVTCSACPGTRVGRAGEGICRTSRSCCT